MRNDNYIYPAIFTYEDTGISIDFPDLPGICTCGENDGDAIASAQEALELHLWSMEQDGEDFPAPTPVTALHANPGQTIVPVRANMRAMRLRRVKKAVTKTVTVPQWLAALADDAGLGLSTVLQDALQQALGVSRPEEIAAYRARCKRPQSRKAS